MIAIGHGDGSAGKKPLLICDGVGPAAGDQNRNDALNHIELRSGTVTESAYFLNGWIQILSHRADLGNSGIAGSARGSAGAGGGHTRRGLASGDALPSGH